MASKGRKKDVDINPGCGRLLGVICAPHFMSSVFSPYTSFFLSYWISAHLSSFCLLPFSIHSSCFVLTGAARVSCTWGSPSVKMASMYWDRTALPLTRSQKSSTFTPHTNSQSAVQSTCPCCSPSWCRHSDWPWCSSQTVRIYLYRMRKTGMFDRDFPSGVPLLDVLDWTTFKDLTNQGPMPSTTTAVVPVPNVSTIRDQFTWNA